MQGFPLVESDHFLRKLIRRNGDLSSAFSRQIHRIAKDTRTQMVEQADIFFFNIFPEFSLLLQILLRAGADQHDRRDDRDDLQIVNI